ncbi:VIT family protein [Fluviicola sp.]|uniref:VIT1/CCC1 transporter family protein n=1 Tax=Fluviicola sp. TaxID=1917219 RepID=UPI0031D7EB1D
MHEENHYINRIGWLRAAVLGANDGILSTTSLVIGVAAASTGREPVILSALAGLVAGALSMAAGEYVSVSSQSDIEHADLHRERKALTETPEEELIELADIYEKRGLSKELAMKVAEELTRHNALDAHARDELGINEITQPRPFQAAVSSGLSFLAGGILPLCVAFWAPVRDMIYFQYGFAIIFLAILGAISARSGGVSPWKPVMRLCLWGTAAMCVTAGIGYLFGVNAG